MCMRCVLCVWCGVWWPRCSCPSAQCSLLHKKRDGLWNRPAASASVSQEKRWQCKDRDTGRPAKPGVFVWGQQGKGPLKVNQATWGHSLTGTGFLNPVFSPFLLLLLPVPIYWTSMHELHAFYRSSQCSQLPHPLCSVAEEPSCPL